MSEKNRKRELVKTVAIIFLTVLLVLTFFSNTIMNMSLPEVSTSYISYGNIKTQVRGSGQVTSQDNYNVIFDGTRRIERVAVRSGMEVAKGDVLFYLEEGESDELDAAKKNYEDLKYSYEKMLIESSSDSIIEKELEVAQLEDDLAEVQAKLALVSKDGQRDTIITSLKQEISALKKEITAKEKEIQKLEAEKSAIGYTPSEDEVLTGKVSDVTYEQYIDATKKIDQATEKVEKLEEEYTGLQNKLDLLPSSGEIESLQSSILNATRDIEDKEADLKYLRQEFYANSDNDKLQDLYYDYEKAYKKYKRLKENGASEKEIYDAKIASDEAYDIYREYILMEEEQASSEEKRVAEAETALRRAYEDLEVMQEKLEKMLGDFPEVSDLEDKVNQKKTEYELAKDEKEALEKSLEKVRNGYKYALILEYEDKISTKEQEKEVLNDKLSDKQDTLSEFESENSESEDTLKEREKSLTRQLANAKLALENEREQAERNSKLYKLELEKLKGSVEKAYKDYEEVMALVASNEIVSPVSGVVEFINVTAGEKTAPGETLAEISLAEKGFTMSLTVSQEQAAKLTVGSYAEITGYVPYGDEIKVRLNAIKADKNNPQSKQKVLEFTVEGDAVSGQTLAIAIGDKNANYESTVPNTAIREDSDGKYILVVESKNTPISTRYITKRVNVNVIASDDVRSAISGEFESYAYVVATSSKPISAGEQVKLVEN